MSNSSPKSPFCAGPPIEDPQYFVGRQQALNRLTEYMTGDVPTSLNVVGDRKMGKSSLLRYFVHTYGQRLQHSDRRADDFLVVYLSLQAAHCQRETDFFRTVADCLNERLTLTRPGLKFRFWQAQNWDRLTFAETCQRCVEAGVLPVLCLDEFEALLAHRSQTNFDAGFYNSLRPLTQNHSLMLVIASRKSLEIYRKQHRINSQFFDDARTYTLESFTETEVQDLVQLPKGTVSDAVPALTEDEQALATRWGDGHPYRLQLAASCLWEARQQGKSTGVAKKQFDQQLQSGPMVDRPWRWVRRMVWDAPVKVGRSAQTLGLKLDEMAAWIMGLVFLLSPVLLLAGIWNRDHLGQAIGKVQQCLEEGVICLQPETQEKIQDPALERTEEKQRDGTQDTLREDSRP